MDNDDIHELMQDTFSNALDMIRRARQRAFQKVNRELIDLYWAFGKFVSEKTAADGWGKGTVKELAAYIKEREPEIKGFSERNIWRMKQFYEIYEGNEKLSALRSELSWTHNRSIFSRCKTPEEREFYLKMAVQERYSSRDLERQISTSLFERQSFEVPKLAAVTRDLYPIADQVFKDKYSFEFLNLPANHSERDLQHGLVAQLKDFILELGRDFSFIGQEYRLQVGAQDFYVDLLFYHRELQCLVAFELKADKFKPEFMGQLEFYLEALDRDVKKEHENPTIGVLLCKDKDEEVVEYALSRSLSPTMIAQYETKLIPREVLQRKLHELTMESENDE